jgi:hypothetical protein
MIALDWGLASASYLPGRDGRLHLVIDRELVVLDGLAQLAGQFAPHSDRMIHRRLVGRIS